MGILYTESMVLKRSLISISISLALAITKIKIRMLTNSKDPEQAPSQGLDFHLNLSTSV